MQQRIHGTIRGRTIELFEEPGVPDGQEVEVQLHWPLDSGRPDGSGLLRTEGALADDAEWDSIMEAITSQRKLERDRTIGLDDI